MDEHDSRNPPANSDPLVTCPEAYLGLANIAKDHEQCFGRDALYVFLKTHECICKRVSASGSPALCRLNAFFAAECCRVYSNYRDGNVDPEAIPKLWLWVFCEYENDRFAFSKLLPMMTTAHILEDLERALYNVNINKSDYDVVIDDILACAQATIFQGRRDFTIRLLSNFRHWLTLPAAIVISQLRDIAWNTAQKRKKLARSRRK